MKATVSIRATIGRVVFALPLLWVSCEAEERSKDGDAPTVALVRKELRERFQPDGYSSRRAYLDAAASEMEVFLRRHSPEILAPLFDCASQLPSLEFGRMGIATLMRSAVFEDPVLYEKYVRSPRGIAAAVAVVCEDARPRHARIFASRFLRFHLEKEHWGSDVAHVSDVPRGALLLSREQINRLAGQLLVEPDEDVARGLVVTVASYAYWHPKARDAIGEFCTRDLSPWTRGVLVGSVAKQAWAVYKDKNLWRVVIECLETEEDPFRRRSAATPSPGWGAEFFNLEVPEAEHYLKLVIQLFHECLRASSETKHGSDLLTSIALSLTLFNHPDIVRPLELFFTTADVSRTDRHLLLLKMNRVMEGEGNVKHKYSACRKRIMRLQEQVSVERR